MPAAEYVWVGLRAVDVEPSPKVHSHVEPFLVVLWNEATRPDTETVKLTDGGVPVGAGDADGTDVGDGDGDGDGALVGLGDGVSPAVAVGAGEGDAEMGDGVGAVDGVGAGAAVGPGAGGGGVGDTSPVSGGVGPAGGSPEPVAPPSPAPACAPPGPPDSGPLVPPPGARAATAALASGVGLPAPPGSEAPGVGAPLGTPPAASRGLDEAVDACCDAPATPLASPAGCAWSWRPDPMSTATTPVVPATSMNKRRLCRSGLRRRRVGRLATATSTAAAAARARSCIAGEVASGALAVISGAPLVIRLAHPDVPDAGPMVFHGGAEFVTGHEAWPPARSGQSARMDSTWSGAAR